MPRYLARSSATMPLVLDQGLFVSDPDQYRLLLASARKQLGDLSDYYPEFDKWYNQKVLPGIQSGERSIILTYSSQALSGLAIVKRTDTEKKLCCLRVVPGFQGSGSGLKLFEKAFDILETTSPLLSVAEERLSVFEKLFDYYGFELARHYRDIYRPQKSEFSFNGLLDSHGRPLTSISGPSYAQCPSTLAIS
ncbi:MULTISPECIES: GNAT family N-acetyltransferase [unclassified Cupriavidus]|uniref:GNAT family N-acetyltransferase n=1 Tax=unclassified Cupriavidus TaxID=2640874 RepID=UPI00313C8F7D